MKPPNVVRRPGGGISRSSSSSWLRFCIGLLVSCVLSIWLLLSLRYLANTNQSSTIINNKIISGSQNQLIKQQLPPPPLNNVNEDDPNNNNNLIPPTEAALSTNSLRTVHDENNNKKTTLVRWYVDDSCKNPQQNEPTNQLFQREPKESRPRSFQIIGPGHGEFFRDETFVFSAHAFDGCIRMFHYPSPNKMVLYDSNKLLDFPQIDIKNLNQQRKRNGIRDQEIATGPAKYRIVFSCESSEYFGYQTWANNLGFYRSHQGDATWTRLLTCYEPDDISVDPRFPTFTAQRHLYSSRYSPINKPDVLHKWYVSKDAPKEEVIVVIDPDSWLVRSFEPPVNKVKRGHAIGQVAYYHGSRTAQRLWKELCEANCDRDMDLVGVPYIVHRDDLRDIAPLWKYYVLKIKYEMEREGKPEAEVKKAEEFEQKYKGLDVNWASEMYGFNMAAAHLGIKFDVEHNLQVRDVDGERTDEQCKNKLSIHMGRAWFPKGDPNARKWKHTEGRSFSMYGDQVWCKCNYTASTVMPWPIPSSLDFVSRITLQYLHDSIQEFGPIPENEMWRHKKDLRHSYGHAHP
jgi:hypothetical protein